MNKHTLVKVSFKTILAKDGSPGLVVMGGDSCSEGHEFKSQHCSVYWMDIFSHLLVVKIVNFV